MAGMEIVRVAVGRLGSTSDSAVQCSPTIPSTVALQWETPRRGENVITLPTCTRMVLPFRLRGNPTLIVSRLVISRRYCACVSITHVQCES